MATIKILLADKYAHVRVSIKSQLIQNAQLEFVGEAASNTELLEKVEATQPDIVLADIHETCVGGLEVMEEIHYLHPGTNCIIMTTHFERDYVVRAIKAGVKGYITKDCEKAEFYLAIRKVYEGERYFNWNVANVLAEVIANPVLEAKNDLTSRENEVLALVSRGHSSRNIARLLAISVRTVEAHRVNLLKRMSVSNTAQLIGKATALRWIQS